MHAWQRRGIAYGGDYNPEQWSPETVDEDIARMKDAGVTMVSLGVFAWAALEPEEGRYTFEWFDRVVDKLEAAGIDIDLATATASPPVWLGQTYPETLPMTREGVVWGHGSRQAFSPASTVFREKACALITELARRYAHREHVVMWHVGNEYACHTWECFRPESQEAFRTWLKQKYGSIEALNHAWGTAFWSQTYTDFSQVAAPNPTPTLHNPGHVLDWKRFNDWIIRDLYIAERDAILAVDPDAMVTTNFMGLFPKLDYFAWAEEVGVVSNDCYPDPADPRGIEEFALNADLSRSWAKGKPWILMEQTAAMVQWRPRNSPKRPGQLALWSMQQIARGADAILYFQWRASTAGSETYHSGMLPHVGPQNRSWKEVVSLGSDLKKLAPVVGTHTEATAAVLLDWDALWARQSCVGPTEDDPLFAVRQWYSTLFNQGHVVDFVQGADIADSPHSLIVVPAEFQITEETAENLLAASRRGAQVVLAARTGTQAADGRAVAGYLSGFQEALGARVMDIAPLTGPSALTFDPTHEPTGPFDRISAAVGTPGAAEQLDISLGQELTEQLDGCARATGGMWAEELAVDGAEVLATFADGDLEGFPAVIRSAVGDGALWYVATDAEGALRHAILRAAAGAANAAPALLGAPAGVEVVRREGFTFLLNHSDTEQEVGSVEPGTDLLSDTPTGETVLVAPRSSVVIRH
ncbi:beta-galactosidase [Corynebacterium sp. TAE3-ERU2]|uniref:beta-galactosidase n=1 Tax=Corynebacterium sp. TAE3-ERU2 TaxID=2849497 RepID=UPI001C460E24|nr:beta-galactosidase [Corynebacterium sp. TAE3-ERU2]MBV7302395.1 beta-galactosidase [Corynebacterium sp. TAE3-ERU2]